MDTFSYAVNVSIGTVTAACKTTASRLSGQRRKARSRFRKTRARKRRMPPLAASQISDIAELEDFRNDPMTKEYNPSTTPQAATTTHRCDHNKPFPS
jgi:hypothetical protein